MDSSFLTLPPAYEDLKPLDPPVLSESVIQRGRSPSFLSSVRNMVQHPLKRMRSPMRSPPLHEDNLAADWSPRNTSSRLTSRHSHCGSHIGPCQSSCHASHRPTRRMKARRREPIPSMADYLTLAQLEVVWRSQDTYKGAVEAPRASSPSCENLRPQSRDRGPAYQTNGRLNAWPKPRHYRSHDDISRMRSQNRTPDELYDDIVEYFGK